MMNYLVIPSSLLPAKCVIDVKYELSTLRKLIHTLYVVVICGFRFLTSSN